VAPKTVSSLILWLTRHHRKMSFDEEFAALSRKHGVAFDPKFVFG
jgi:hypothetical protein